MLFGAAPKNYSEMLGQVAFCTFCVLCFAASVVTFLAPGWSEALGPSLELPMVKLKIPGAYLVVVAVLTFLFRTFKLHDQISDLLGIRKRYDYENVFLPVFQGFTGTVRDYLNLRSSILAETR